MRGILGLTLAALLFFNAPCAAAAGRSVDIIRLHVHAHSDTEEEQRIKLLVRDEMLRAVRELVVDATTIAEASSRVERALPSLKITLRDTLQREGSKHDGQLGFGIFLFPSRVYGRLALPAGRYRALNIHIGDGHGKNWWCVMYPPLCLVDGVVNRNGPRRFESALANILRNVWRRFRP
ncbi:MAG: stage II sporulation protein R [Peptococcaceae bacterium]|nr:stage II sporulation protein R [Peptococcaceae bacterium]